MHFYISQHLNLRFLQLKSERILDGHEVNDHQGINKTIVHIPKVGN